MKETMRGRDTEYQHSYVTTKEMFFINLFLDILSLYCHSVVGFVLMCVLHFSSIQHEANVFISMRPTTISKYFT